MINIRAARQDETLLLRDIGLRAWASAVSGIDVNPAMQAAAEAAFESFAVNHWLTISVVEDDGVMAGWAAREKLDETITDFWIDPDHQRRGLGTALLAAVEADILHQGFDTAELQTHARNAAIAFFERGGYTIRWLSVAYSPKLDRDVETVGLSKRLDGEDDDGVYGMTSRLQ